MKNFRKQVNFQHTVTSAEASANVATIQIDEAITGDSFDAIVQVRRSGVEVAGFDTSYSTTTGYLSVLDAGSADLTAGDIITGIGFYYTE